MKLKVITAPNPILRQKSRPVKKISPKIRKLAENLIEIIKFGPEGKRIGVGISAVQIGRPLRLFVAYSQKTKKNLIFINPEIIWRSKKLTSAVPESKNPYEGCLSLPGIWGKVKRHWAVKVRYTTISGRHLTRLFKGFLATVIQHEYDHLDGVLFVDRIWEQKGKIYKLEKNEEDKEILIEVKLR